MWKLRFYPGPDVLPSSGHKEEINSLVHPLVHIINLSLSTGIYSNKFKITKGTPNPNSERNNYQFLCCR